jgi:GAF domain-containing protein
VRDDAAQNSGAEAALAEAVSQMTGVLLGESTLDGVLDLIVLLAHSSMPDLRGVSVSLTRDGRLITAAYSTKHAQEADRGQYETGIGPCVEAVRSGRAMVSADILAEERWPEFTPQALEHGAYGVLALPLRVGDRVVGGLNIYSARPRNFDEVREEAERFARHAAVVLSNAQAYASAEELNDQLKEALETREIIGEAKGILMEREGVSGEEAFEMLRRLSQNANVKLRDVARRVVDSTHHRSHTQAVP